MSETLVIFGFVLLIVGILLIIIGSIGGSKDSKAGFGAVIGPFVFGFGDPQLTKIAIIVSAILAIVFILLFLKGVL